MDAKHLKELLEAAMENKNVQQLYRNITFIISYLVSEQEKRQELGNKIDRLTKRLDDNDKEMIVTKLTVEEIKKSSQANNRMLRAILVAVISGIIIEGLKLVFHK